MMKKFSILLSTLFVIIFALGFVRPDVYRIDAQKNAVIHNNLGLKAISEENYATAIQEFNIAIALNPKTQATAVYYNNLGEVYMKLGYFSDAQRCFQNSITQYSLNFLYYKNLVDAFKAQGAVNSKINYYMQRAEKHSLDMITLGLLYIAKGDVRAGIIKLDEFCMKEPDLLITSGVRNYLKQIVPKY